MDKSGVALEWMRTFVRIAERGSFSAVSREWGVGQSTVTRHIRDLEDAVGAPLLSRTTRRVALTDEGHRYLAYCIQVLRLVEQAGDDIRVARNAVGGTIRISCTSALGILHISRLVFTFQDLYPDIQIDLNLTDERINLVGEGVDIALRLGPVGESSMKLRALGVSQRLLVAAPEYLARRGVPATPLDLCEYDCIRMSNVMGSDRLVLRDPDGGFLDVPIVGKLQVDHGLAAREALLAGRGFAPAHLWLVDDLLRQGRLKVLFPEYSLPSVPLSLLIVPQRADVARVRLLIDYLAKNVHMIPGLGS